jgi:hypothetical protein
VYNKTVFNIRRKIIKSTEMELITIEGEDPKDPMTLYTEKSLPPQPSLERPQLPPINRYCHRYCKTLNKLKFGLLIEVFKICLYLFVAVCIFLPFEYTSSTTLHFKSYFTSSQVVFPSSIRGLFPPLQGSSG